MASLSLRLLDEWAQVLGHFVFSVFRLESLDQLSNLNHHNFKFVPEIRVLRRARGVEALDKPSDRPREAP